MDDERITLRMGTNDVQILDDYLEEHPELGTRSQFIRIALREYMKRDAGTPSDENKGGIFVRLNDATMDAIRVAMENEFAFDNEAEFVRDCIRWALSPKEGGRYAESSEMAKTVQR
jgi:metal-responsive CopG/Arc/MetJ family transcriptional regulator